MGRLGPASLLSTRAQKLMQLNCIAAESIPEPDHLAHVLCSDQSLP